MNLFELFAKITLDDSEYTDGLEKASGKTSKFAESMKNGLETAAKVGAAATAAAAAGVTALVKSAVESYGEYEQLAGGVETLFKSSSDAVMGYASNAYKTAGLSANEYMETVTSFSASLLQSLDNDTAAAAQKADLAITDMSDNANKMGTSMESIQNAYQGFAKQNYTMLDNLKLGYGGTKEEMQRLIDDANALNAAQGVYTEYSIDSYADIVDAIHVVQTEIGITGTTSKEAATTIQGSLSSAKAAWQNLVVGVADDTQDFDVLVDNFVDSVAAAGNNILPRITTALNGASKLITKLVPPIVEKIPKIISDVLPQLTQASVDIVSALATGLVDNAGDLIDALFEAVSILSESVGDLLPDLVVSFSELAMNIAAAVAENLPEIIQNLMAQLPAIIEAAAEASMNLATAAITIVTALALALGEAAPQLLEAGADMIGRLIDGITSKLPDFAAALPQFVQKFLSYITENLPSVLSKGTELIKSLIDGIVGAIPDFVAALPDIIRSLVTFFTENAPQIIQAGMDILGSIIEGVIKAIPELVAALPEIIAAILDGIAALAESIWEIGKCIVEGIWQGIKNSASWLKDKVTGFFSNLIGGVKDFLGIASPSKVFAEIGGFMAAGLGKGWDSEFGGIKKQIEGDMDFGSQSIDFSTSASGKSSSGIINGILQAAGNSSGEYNINVVLDGATLASIMFDPLLAVSKQRGEALA